jgi:hypothetical protein
MDEQWLKDLETRCQQHCDSVLSPLSEALAGRTVKPPKRSRRRAAVATTTTSGIKQQPRIAAQPTGLKMYLAGRISKNDWRTTLVGDDGIYDLDGWRRATTVLMHDGNTYVGPFYLGCDHGCSHGSNSHGAGVDRDYDCIPFPPSHEVFQKAEAGIRACDVFFVWAGPDFNQAFGTLVEIGIAKALGKRIVIGRHPDVALDQWFAFQCADEIIDAKEPVAAYSLMTRTRLLRP